MTLLDGKWIEVFRIGDYGDKGKYTTADLDEMVRNYDPNQHEAPLVLGHPENNAPAYGWAEAFKREGTTLLAKLKQVSPQLESWVDSGAYKKRSISFYSKPKLMVRHIGFLGAMPPEVKGLADVKFAAGEFESIDFKEQESGMDITEIRKSFVDALKEFFTTTRPEQKTFTEADIAKAVEAAAKPFQDKLTAMETQFSELKKTHDAAQTANADASVTNLAETAIRTLKDAKKWIPAFDKMGVAQIFGELAKSDKKVEFGEGDKKTQKTVLMLFGEFLAGLPEIVPTKEITTAAASARKGKVIKFNDTNDAHSAIDEQSIAFADAAMELSHKEKIPYGEALTRVRAEYVAKEGGAA